MTDIELALLLVSLTVSFMSWVWWVHRLFLRSLEDYKIPADHILCTPSQVIAAVSMEYRSLPRVAELSPERVVTATRTSAERIAANLIQITE